MSVASSSAWGDEAETSLEALQGSWRSVAVEMSGRELPDTAGDLTIVFAKNTVIVMVRDQVGSQGTFTIDVSKNPKTIDIVYDRDGGGDPQRAFGLYKIDGGKLTLITGEGDEKERPKGFACERGKAHMMVTLERSPE